MKIAGFKEWFKEMKFKYNFLENQLSRIEEDYTYQITENNYFHTNEGIYGTNGFHLGEQEQITFTFISLLGVEKS